MSRMNPEEFQPAIKKLITKYAGRKHPLNFSNWYELIVVVVLAARATDERVNQITPEFFKKYPTMKDLAKAKPQDLFRYIGTITNFANKAKWLVGIAKALKDAEKPPLVIDELIKLPGIGRKTANFIISQLGGEMQGFFVDLHVLRVATRLGITDSSNPEKVEQGLMKLAPQKYWKDLGMSMTFLGREICRPTNPKCPECVMNEVCAYYKATAGRN